jgi:hypothetical protein
VPYKDFYLVDGAISANTPIKVAVAKGAQRLIILPTGYACSTHAPPAGAVANALHALTLLIARQLVSELEDLDPRSNTSWCRRYVRWSDRPMISREPPIISSARSGAPTRGWRKTAWRKAGFPRRCARIVTEPREIRPGYVALQNSLWRVWVRLPPRRIDLPPADPVASSKSLSYP